MAKSRDKPALYVLTRKLTKNSISASFQRNVTKMSTGTHKKNNVYACLRLIVGMEPVSYVRKVLSLITNKIHVHVCFFHKYFCQMTISVSNVQKIHGRI